MRSLTDVFYNFHWIVPDQAARAAQAYAGRLGPFLRAHGIRAVINLRGPNPDWGWWHYERRICAQQGIVHQDAMLSSKNLPSRAMLKQLLAAFEHCPRPFLLKCSGGQDRTSFAAALFVLHQEGWNSEAAALQQFARWPYLHMPKPHQRWLRLFPVYARETATGMALARFIDEAYSVASFQAWLAAHGAQDSYKNAYREAA